MPHAIATPMSTYQVLYLLVVPGLVLTAMNSKQWWKRVPSQFFVQDLRLALVAKTRPHRLYAFKKVNTNGQEFASAKNKINK